MTYYENVYGIPLQNFKHRMAHEMIQYLMCINKIFTSITILETNIQKETPMHTDLSSVNQVFSMTTITSGNFFNTNCDVDYSTAHILSYLGAGLND
jgi:hypothetical protein